MADLKQELIDSPKVRLSPREIEDAFSVAPAGAEPVVGNLLIAVREGQIEAFKAHLARECQRVRLRPSDSGYLGDDEVAIVEDAYPSPIVKAALHVGEVVKIVRWDIVEQIEPDRDVKPL